jgi:hypothetical protein
VADNQLDELVDTVLEPSAGRMYASAWALECDLGKIPRVELLRSLSALPRRIPLSNELFLWFGTPRAVEWRSFAPHLNQEDCEQIARQRHYADSSIRAPHARYSARCYQRQ